MKNCLFILLMMIVTTAIKPVDSTRLVILPSGRLVLPEMGRMEFTCYSTLARLSHIHWEVNGSRYDDDIIDIPGFQQPHFNDQSQVGRLIISNITSQLNETHLRCYTSVSQTSQASMEVVIIVQGRLDAVGNLSVTRFDNSSVYLSWTTPFTLQDSWTIDYCIDVFNTYGLSNNIQQLVYSKCDLQTLWFLFYYENYSSNMCSQLKYRVTPRNSVGNGSSSDIYDSPIYESVEAPQQISTSDIEVRTSAKINTVYLNISMHQLLLYYSINITDLNQNVLFSYNNYDDNTSPVFTNFSQIVVTLTALAFNTNYQLSFQAQNCNGTVSSIENFNTFKLQHAQAIECINCSNCLYLTLHYSEEMQPCSRVLAVLHHRDRDSNPLYYSLSHHEAHVTYNFTLQSVPTGYYQIFFYGMSVTEVLESRLPALTLFANVTVNDGKEINNQPDATCSSMPITTTSINLTCLSSSTNDTNLPTVQGYGIVIHELNSTVIEMGHIIGPFLELVLNLERYNFHKLVVYPIYTRQSYGCGFFSSLRRDVVYSQVINAEYFLTEFSSTTNSLIDGFQEHHHELISKNDIITIGIPCGIILYILGAVSSIFLIVAFKSIKQKCKTNTKSNTEEILNTTQAQNVLATVTGPIYEDIEMNAKANASQIKIDLMENVAYGKHQ